MASKKKLPLSRNIIRHTNKNGDYYYYDYNKEKITSKDSWKSQNTRIKKRNEEIRQQERQHRQHLKRKREQAEEKEEERRRKLSLKRKKEAKRKKAAPAPVPVTKKEFPSNFQFFNARAVFGDPVFDGIKVTINFNDPANSFSSAFSDLAEEFSAWYTISGTYMHLRDYYNDSPPAAFKLVNTDDSTFAEYIITT